jgi:SOUL heme-binding protein
MFFRLIFVSLFLFSQTAMAIEEPKFDVIEKADAFELRAYKPLIVAEVLVDGDMKQASSKGFKLIADYIFGNNKSQTGDKTGSSEKISMTAPVTLEAQKASPKSEKVAMTAPVAVQKEAEKWRVHFVMPSQYSLETLPTPNNPQVTLREVAAKKFAVVRFSGLVGEEKMATKTAELQAWMQTKQLKPIGTPELARYNPPWTLPFLRRNEILIEY